MAAELARAPARAAAGWRGGAAARGPAARPRRADALPPPAAPAQCWRSQEARLQARLQQQQSAAAAIHASRLESQRRAQDLAAELQQCPELQALEGQVLQHQLAPMAVQWAAQWGVQQAGQQLPCTGLPQALQLDVQQALYNVLQLALQQELHHALQPDLQQALHQVIDTMQPVRDCQPASQRRHSSFGAL